MRLGRAFGRGLASPRFQGIRFRLGLAMALALLPFILLIAVQTQAGFRRQAEEQRADLQLAAERSAAAAKGRLDGATVLLQALSPEALGLYCEPRLTSLIERLDGYEALYRVTATGEPACTSRLAPGAHAPTGPAIRSSAWFERLRGGDTVAVTRAPISLSGSPALLVAVRNERPLGAFDGAMAAILPLAGMQPDIRDRALPEGSEAALTDGDGRILVATSPAAFALQEGSLLGWVKRARADTSSVFEAHDSSGRRRVYAGAALSGRDVYVLLSAPAPGLLSWARLNPISTLLLPLGAWLTAFAAVMLFSERIVVRWLDYLERIAAIYARGRFSVRPVQAVNAPSEIRVLARTLDQLAEAITLRDRSLNESLEEKDALMREIHHRVKNNLQIISSLLSMQQRSVGDPAAKAALGDTRQRISALALIYRTLYQSEDIRHADARDFLTELVGQLVAGGAMRGPMVTSAIDSDSLIIDPDKLAPLALWLVEAVSNAQKHAFAERGGHLGVRFKVKGSISVLEVQDDGPGVDADQAEGVGRTLMGAFAKQLRGSAEMVAAPGGGSIARLAFPTPEALTPADPRDLGTGPSARR